MSNLFYSAAGSYFFIGSLISQTAEPEVYQSIPVVGSQVKDEKLTQSFR